MSESTKQYIETMLSSAGLVITRSEILGPNATYISHCIEQIDAWGLMNDFESNKNNWEKLMTFYLNGQPRRRDHEEGIRIASTTVAIQICYEIQRKKQEVVQRGNNSSKYVRLALLIFPSITTHARNLMNMPEWLISLNSMAQLGTLALAACNAYQQSGGFKENDSSDVKNVGLLSYDIDIGKTTMEYLHKQLDSICQQLSDNGIYAHYIMMETSCFEQVPMVLDFLQNREYNYVKNKQMLTGGSKRRNKQSKSKRKRNYK
jgi:hypothetical protein